MFLPTTQHCGGEACWITYWSSPDLTRHYDLDNIITTPMGIHIDTSGQQVDLEALDRQTREVEECLDKNFPDHVLPDEVTKEAYCQYKTFNLPINLNCFKVKVPNDWILDEDSGQQLLNIKAPDAGCLAKGLVPTADKPCRWRGYVQDYNTILITPNEYLYKDWLLRVTVGCGSGWGNKVLAECIAPSVPLK